jgi:CRISPR-associated protein Cas1
MATLYATTQGAVVRRVGQRLIVSLERDTLDTIRLRELERVVLFGNITLTPAAIAVLLEAGIETTFLSMGGRYRGRLTPADAKNVFVRQAQFRRYDDLDFRMRTARSLLDGKLRNSRQLLLRHGRDHPSEALSVACDRIEAARGRLGTQTDLASLLGVEGDAARAYFAAFGGMVRADFAFTVRSRRPPKDPVNALLSFGYTLLGSEITGAAAAAGMDPFVGVLHELDYGRPSLGLDLLEEFRQPVVDRLALSLVNRSVLRPEHFEDRAAAGVLLNDVGRPIFLAYYHRALEAEFMDRSEGGKTAYRLLFRRQARRMRASIMDGTEYEPYRAR